MLAGPMHVLGVALKRRVNEQGKDLMSERSIWLTYSLRGSVIPQSSLAIWIS